MTALSRRDHILSRQYARPLLDPGQEERTDLLALVHAAIPSPIAQLLTCEPAEPRLFARLIDASDLALLALTAPALPRLATTVAGERLLDRTRIAWAIVAGLLAPMLVIPTRQTPRTDLAARRRCVLHPM